MDRDSVDQIVSAWHDRDPDLDASTLQVIGRLLLCAGHFERMAIAALEPYGLSIADFDVLNTLHRVGDRAGSKPTDLARASLITTGAMTSRLDRLERAGLIRRRPDPADRRGILVKLTARGAKVAHRALRALIDVNESYLDPLSTQQRDTLASTLKTLLLRQENLLGTSVPDGSAAAF
ncbi:MarR family transcriptional regulator [Hamadaea sp. NPDC050747]|uniref:MarR family winged helix-turn-helix transcriptional regulator n=1 Tax=Hamadaea sp. NPDC050747 TaxID=3155789 RepID=UPI0033D866F4